MKILYINQPINNRGDESACKALLRLLSDYSDIKIDVLFTYGSNNSIYQMKVEAPNINYIYLKPQHYRSFKKIAYGALRRNVKFLWYLHPDVRRYINLFKRYDLILNSPGGISLGGFQNWSHLFLLHIAMFLKKPIAYYGRSFGPFPIASSIEQKYAKLSYQSLRYFSFLSIRDKKTETIADELHLKYISTVDTAFLEQPKVCLNDDIINKIGEDYVVFVPNLLIWHYNYVNRVKKETVLFFFVRIAKILLRRFPSSKIVMLPQTFNNSKPIDNDKNFFLELESNIQNESIIVLDDQYSSDIQQTIISSAKCVVGARYHSVVFAINNCVPFLALSYEHKISGLLETLHKEDCMIDIVNAFESDNTINKTLDEIDSKLVSVYIDKASQEKAHSIAKKTFDQLLDYIHIQK